MTLTLFKVSISEKVHNVNLTGFNSGTTSQQILNYDDTNE